MYYNVEFFTIPSQTQQQYFIFTQSILLCEPVILFTIQIIQIARISPKKKAELFRLQIQPQSEATQEGEARAHSPNLNYALPLAISNNKH
ncbi:hypothetical protein B7990_02315 [Fibrobacter sp. UWB4]|nr:hypothetical protein B7990_02315 [Fibrobacter sp. UWB4]